MASSSSTGRIDSAFRTPDRDKTGKKVPSSVLVSSASPLSRTPKLSRIEAAKYSFAELPAVIIRDANKLYEHKIVDIEVKEVTDINAGYFYKLVTSLVYYLNHNSETKGHYVEKINHHMKKSELIFSFFLLYNRYISESAKRLPFDSKVIAIVNKVYASYNTLSLNRLETITSNLKAYLQELEAEEKDYFGSYLSDDDSDNDDKPIENDVLKQMPRHLKNKTGGLDEKKTIEWLSSLNDDKVRNNIFKIAKEQFCHPILSSTEIKDLDLLNNAIKKKYSITSNPPKPGLTITDEKKLQHTINTEFKVLSLRGIGYYFDRWNQRSRRAHRKFHEIGRSQFCERAFNALGDLSLYLNFDRIAASDADFWEKLENNGRDIQQTLTSLRSTGYIAYKRGGKYYLFNNLLEYLQYAHSNGIANYYQIVSLLSKKDQEWANVFNRGNLFVPTGDMPAHPLRYGFCIKPPLKVFSPDPRWNKLGQAERPYTGKLYAGSHPIASYIGKSGPNHVPSMYVAGDVPLGGVIAPEAEVAFLGYIEPGIIFAADKIRYPSFYQDYKPIFQYKYYLTPFLYNYFKEKILNSAPHSAERNKIKEILRNWITYGHAIKYMLIAKQHAKTNKYTIIFKDTDGTFKFNPPVATGVQIKDKKREELAEKIFKKELGEVLLKVSGSKDKIKRQLFKDNMELREILPDQLEELDEEFVARTKNPFCPDGSLRVTRSPTRIILEGIEEKKLMSPALTLCTQPAELAEGDESKEEKKELKSEELSDTVEDVKESKEEARIDINEDVEESKEQVRIDTTEDVEETKEEARVSTEEPKSGVDEIISSLSSFHFDNKHTEEQFDRFLYEKDKGKVILLPGAKAPFSQKYWLTREQINHLFHIVECGLFIDIEFHYCEFREEFAAIINHIFKSRKIINICFHDCNINDEMIKIISNWIEKGACVERLIIAKSNCTDDGAAFLGKAIRTNRSLRYIELSDPFFIDRGAQIFLEKILGNQSLQAINLDYVVASQKVLELLAENAEQNPKLTHCIFEGLELGGTGGIHGHMNYSLLRNEVMRAHDYLILNSHLPFRPKGTTIATHAAAAISAKAVVISPEIMSASRRVLKAVHPKSATPPRPKAATAATSVASPGVSQTALAAGPVSAASTSSGLQSAGKSSSLNMKPKLASTKGEHPKSAALPQPKAATGVASPVAPRTKSSNIDPGVVMSALLKALTEFNERMAKLKGQWDSAGVRRHTRAAFINGEQKIFSEYEVERDGDCGFTVLGISRSDAVISLMRLIDNPHKRLPIVKELVAAFELFNNARDEEYDPTEYMDPGIRTRFIRYYNRLTVAREEGGNTEAILAEMANDRGIFTNYVQSYNPGDDQQGLWLGVESMRCIAEQREIGLTILGERRGSKDLHPLPHSVPIAAGGACVYVILRGGHYNLLVEEGPVLREEKAKTVTRAASSAIKVSHAGAEAGMSLGAAETLKKTVAHAKTAPKAAATPSPATAATAVTTPKAAVIKIPSNTRFFYANPPAKSAASTPKEAAAPAKKSAKKP